MHYRFVTYHILFSIPGRRPQIRKVIIVLWKEDGTSKITKAINILIRKVLDTIIILDKRKLLLRCLCCQLSYTKLMASLKKLMRFSKTSLYQIKLFWNTCQLRTMYWFIIPLYKLNAYLQHIFLPILDYTVRRTNANRSYNLNYIFPQ